MGTPVDAPLTSAELAALHAGMAEIRAGMMDAAAEARWLAAVARVRDAEARVRDAELLAEASAAAKRAGVELNAAACDRRAAWWAEQIATLERVCAEYAPTGNAPDAALRAWATYHVRGYSGASDPHWGIARLRRRFRRAAPEWAPLIPEPLGRRDDRGARAFDRWPLDWPRRRRVLLAELRAAALAALRAPGDEAIEMLALAGERADALYTRDPLLTRTAPVESTIARRRALIRAALEAEHDATNRRRALPLPAAAAATFFVPAETLRAAFYAPKR